MTNSGVIARVEAIYAWIDAENSLQWDDEQRCRGCGKCCDFESFDHRLFVTTPEMVYFEAKLGIDGVKTVENGRCPYNIEGKCGVYESRFGGCRIFNCRGDAEAQGRVSEEAARRFKAVCEDLGVPYRYVDLATGLKELSCGSCR